MADEERDKFVVPEVMDAKPDQGGYGLVLVSKELPQRLLLLTELNKPLFPGMMFPLVFENGREADTLRAANEGERVVGFVLSHADGDAQGGGNRKRLSRIGTAARILRFEEMPDGHVQALCQGQRRFELLSVRSRDGLLEAEVVYPQDILEESADVKALSLSIMNTMRELIRLNPLYSEEMKVLLSRADWSEPGRLADFSVSITASTPEEMQEVLECLNVKERLEKVLFLMRKEVDLNELKEKITHQIEEKISKQQREFFLREQLKAIKQELGLEKDDKEEEMDRYRERLEAITPHVSSEVVKRIEEELDKLNVLNNQSPEYAVTRTYLDWLTELPWEVTTEDKLDVARAREVLNRDHYGLEDVKKRILEFIGVAKLKGSVDGSIICLVGPPGVGKTSLGRSIAETLGRKFFRFSLGGMRDEAEIKGHRRTYIGALPGKVIEAIKISGSTNPVIMLDEIDKLGKSFQGDPASALLEVLDPEQNSSFRDHYLDVPFDLSKVLFIATANVQEGIPAPLLDRMELITLSGYITDEKLNIGKRHLVPKLLPRNGLTKKDLSFSDSALRAIIMGYAREAGVRAFEKALGGCMRKVAAGLAEGTISGKTNITTLNLKDFLGKPRFEDDPLMRRNRLGVAMGLAWTALGGATLYVEVLAVPGKNGIKLTGQLGDVMKESTQIACSMVEANASVFGIDSNFFKDRLLHVHVPAGATPKDGPSAGITMASAIISLARRQTLPARWAMTGELTLTGRVLPVGGIKEKMIAARRAGVRNVILPGANEKDFSEIPERVREGLTVHYVEDYKEVFALLFKK
ncbi:MAG: endopeptidase La [Lentisphaerae bacterium]|nr:endopeptidase La [Lentisphaerota bacterium]